MLERPREDDSTLRPAGEESASLCFENGDVADLTAKLRALLELPHEEHARIAAAARKAVVRRWSWAGVAGRLLQPFN